MRCGGFSSGASALAIDVAVIDGSAVASGFVRFVASASFLRVLGFFWRASVIMPIAPLLRLRLFVGDFFGGQALSCAVQRAGLQYLPS